MLAPLDDLEAAFQLWRSRRDQILGFEPRVIHCDGDEERRANARDIGRVLDAQAGLPNVVPAGGLESKIPEGCQYKFKLPNGFFDIVVRFSAGLGVRPDGRVAG